MTMNASQLIAIHLSLTDQARLLLHNKNQDYAAHDDPFRNFNSAIIIGISPAQLVLGRLLDKVSRLGTFASTGQLSTDSALDSVLDIINYAVLFAAMSAIATAPPSKVSKGQPFPHNSPIE